MSEHSPRADSHEKEPDYSTYQNIANEYFDNYVGEALPKDIQPDEVDAWRNKQRRNIADYMANIASDMPQAERVAKYAEIIQSLKEMADSLNSETEPSSNEEPTMVKDSSETSNGDDEEDPSDDNTREKLSLWAKANVMPSIMLTRFRGYVDNINEKRAESIEQAEGESDADYEKRMKRHKRRTRIAGVALVGVTVGAIAASKFAPGIIDWLTDGGNGGGSGANLDTADVPQSDTGYGESDYGDGSNLDIDADPMQSYEQSIQAEREFLETNGRTGNDFNYIDPNGSREDIIAELHNQYSKSPTELAGQLHQIQGIEDAPIELLPEELRLQDGETYDDYTARLSEALHRDPALHDSLVEYTVEYVDGNFKVLDMPNYYEAAYIDENGVTYWDHHVTSADSNDKIIMLADGKGIRLPCGQPVEFTLGAPAGVGGGAPVGMGGAPVHDTPGAHYTPPAQDTPGVGGGPPPIHENPPHNPPGGETPPENPPEETPPEETPPELAPKSENPDDYMHIVDAPKAEFEGWAPPAQTEYTPPAVTEQQPGQEIGYDEPAAHAPGAEVVTPEENQQREQTPPAQGATTPENPGTENTNPF